VGDAHRWKRFQQNSREIVDETQRLFAWLPFLDRRQHKASGATIEGTPSIVADSAADHVKKEHADERLAA
jgi:hypothetical protein